MDAFGAFPERHFTKTAPEKIAKTANTSPKNHIIGEPPFSLIRRVGIKVAQHAAANATDHLDRLAYSVKGPGNWIKNTCGITARPSRKALDVAGLWGMPRS
jgi:hypothetical protein